MTQTVDANACGSADDYEAFLRLYSRHQLQVMAYIRALIHDPHAAGDVFQETSLELWRSFASFRRDADFMPWALGIARHQMLKHWRTRDRDRHVFGETLMTQLSENGMSLAREIGPRQEALEECVQRLNERQQSLVRMFYGDNLSAAAIAASWGRSVHTVYRTLGLVRRTLLDCVERRLSSESA